MVKGTSNFSTSFIIIIIEKYPTIVMVCFKHGQGPGPDKHGDEASGYT